MALTELVICLNLSFEAASGGLGQGSACQQRAADVYNALKRLGFDTDPSARRPQDQHVVLFNREPFDVATVGGTRKS